MYTVVEKEHYGYPRTYDIEDMINNGYELVTLYKYDKNCYVSLWKIKDGTK